MAAFLRRLFAPVDGDRIAVRLDDTVRELIGSMCEQLRELLLVDDVGELRRLYPNAYPDDPDRENAYRELVHDQLLMNRLEAIDLVVETLGADELDLDQADAWMNTLNQIRLVLGTTLDVSEADHSIDPDDPEAGSHVVYQLLSHVLDALTEARSSYL